jgi:magnesium transporter
MSQTPSDRPEPASAPGPADVPEASLYVARLDETVSHTLHRLRAAGVTDWELLCVVDDEGRLIGTVSPQRLLLLGHATLLRDGADRTRRWVRHGTDEELAASQAIAQGAAALPVVDEQGRPLRVLGAHALMDILRREHVEDLHRLAGIGAEQERAREASDAPPMRRARHRLPWLIVGLGGSVLATGVVAQFEDTLRAQPSLAFFVPGLVYLADAIGTQSEAVAVRSLSLSRVGWGRLLGGELRTGLLIGLVLALLTGPLVWIGFGDPALALAVSLALACAGGVATAMGTLLPLLLSRFSVDPAYGSGPLATIIQDVLTLVVYFGCVTLLVV